ncbi:MAG TPA: T9SS type A sorting domain-containing protein [Bacteroidia bacterium]|nr:T9SS type A sorting domain-containing protein [Bacteroidia bacterium]HNU33914.1 T9SS type A sorting domain-containing protein [Bacteroidia bacterium]
MNETIQNVTINTAVNPYKAFKTLTASNNVIIQNGGSVDFIANNEVNIQTEFHAASGSEVHIFNEQVFADCNEISTLGFRTINHSDAQNSDSKENSIELTFKKQESLTVFPNPNQGIFNIEYDGDENIKKDLKVFDIIGNLIFSTNFMQSSFQIDLATLSKGVYYINLQTKISTFTPAGARLCLVAFLSDRLAAEIKIPQYLKLINLF